MAKAKMNLVVFNKKPKISRPGVHAKSKTSNLKQSKNYVKNIEDKENSDWNISIGFYPGLLIGMRTYYSEDYVQHVIYLPLIDIAIEIER
jgi:hypothetical protein